ncbi:MAG: T9SS type A sorting domain-containing protein [bacterium]
MKHLVHPDQAGNATAVRLFVFISLIVGTQFILSSIVNATNVSGTISTNTLWDTTGSPYIVTGNVTVDTLVTLRIEPGVKVLFNTAKGITIKGNLYAIGTSTDSIIISALDTTNWAQRWRNLCFQSPSTCSLKYCRIEYADSSAIYNNGSDSIYIGYNTILNNSTTYGGGGIHNYGTAEITNNTISGNSDKNLNGRGGGICNYGTAEIINNTIANNHVFLGYGGGGIHNGNYDTAKITNNIISNNSGGGICNFGIAEITNNTISNNSGETGGGICSQSGTVEIISNTISNNSSNNTGGGIYNVAIAKIMNNNIISNNSSNTGGGIANYYTTEIISNAISKNSSGNSGGGIFNSGTSNAKIINNIIIDNHSNCGGGIYNNYGTAKIINNTISNNLGVGGSIYSYTYSTTTIRYNTITDTTAFAIFISEGSPFIRTNNIYATGYAVHNATTNNINARYNYWNTTDTATINNLRILDYYDYVNAGIVFYKPFLDTAFTDTIAPPPPINLTANKIDSTFEVSWTNPYDTSGISEYYYKLGSAPTSDFDTTHTFHYSPDTINVTSNKSLYVWLVDSSGNLNYLNSAVAVIGVEENEKTLDKVVLFSPSPNPSLNSMTIKYGLPEKANVSLRLYDISGRMVKTLYSEIQEKGYHTVNIRKGEFPKGVYFIKFAAGNYKETKKLILMK